MVAARLLTNCSNSLRNIHNNNRQNITRTCAKWKAGYFSMAHLVYMVTNLTVSVLVGPCHHGMARPQVADRGTASDKEGSCE